VASISSTAECIFAVTAGEESVAAKAAGATLGAAVGTNLGTGSAKLVSCEEPAAAAAASARSSVGAALVVAAPDTAALAGCCGTLSFV
jgi:hypothetical protein